MFFCQGIESETELESGLLPGIFNPLDSTQFWPIYHAMPLRGPKDMLYAPVFLYQCPSICLHATGETHCFFFVTGIIVMNMYFRQFRVHSGKNKNIWKREDLTQSEKDQYNDHVTLQPLEGAVYLLPLIPSSNTVRANNHFCVRQKTSRGRNYVIWIILNKCQMCKKRHKFLICCLFLPACMLYVLRVNCPLSLLYDSF